MSLGALLSEASSSIWHLFTRLETGSLERKLWIWVVSSKRDVCRPQIRETALLRETVGQNWVVLGRRNGRALISLISLSSSSWRSKKVFLTTSWASGLFWPSCMA